MSKLRGLYIGKYTVAIDEVMLDSHANYNNLREQVRYPFLKINIYRIPLLEI